MKRILVVGLILLLVVALLGCQNKGEAEEVKSFEFEYKFKPEYSDKIRAGLAGAFIDFTRDTLSLYLIGFEDFEPTVENEFSNYMGKVILEYRKRIDTYNEDEKELLELMTEQWDNVTVLNMLKLYYAEDKINKSMGIATKYDDKYYEEELIEIKQRVEDTLEKAKKFID